MVQVSINIYKVITRYTFNGREEKSEYYFVNLDKAMAYAEKESKTFYVAIHELEEDENGKLTSINCIKVW